MKRARIEHRFVDAIPARLEEGVVYVSIGFATVVHKCLCGCGQEVVTPLSPTDWRLTFDGASISLDPSVGNWSFDCQSHYWITRNRVRWAGKMSREQIAAVREQDVLAKAAYGQRNGHASRDREGPEQRGIVRRILRFIGLGR